MDEVYRVDDIDRTLVTKLCEQFNISLDEDLSGEITTFTLDGLISIESPSADTNGKWAVSVASVRPGVRTFPNGDPGYPDEVDITDLCSCDTLTGALTEAVKYVVENRVETIDFAIKEDAFYADQERVEREAENYMRHGLREEDVP